MEDDEHTRFYVLRQPSIVPQGMVSMQSGGSLPDELIRRLSIHDPVSER